MSCDVLQKLAKEALAVQNACNLSGVVHSFSRAMTELREVLSKEPDFSTEKLNQHPIAILFSSKIASLTGSEQYKRFSDAYSICMALTESKK